MKKILGLLFIVLLLLGVVYWVSQKDTTSAAPLTTADFAIEDTSAIGRIIITKADGDKVELARGKSNQWVVNEKYNVRKDAIDLIMKTLHLLEVKHPVSSQSREAILRMMAGRHQYVQVFDREEEFLKGYFIGTQTADERGTYMVLEQPDIGRSEIPYVMTMKAFYGYLNSRFFTNEKDWRDRTILRYPELQFERVEVENNLHPDRSFAIEYKGGNELSMFDLPENDPIPLFDTARVKDYLLLYKRASCETYELAFEQHQIDSILALDPSFEVKITAKDPERSKHLRLFLRPAPEGDLDPAGNPREHDIVIMYGTLDGEVLFRVQRFVIDAFLPPKQAFTGELDF